MLISTIILIGISFLYLSSNLLMELLHVLCSLSGMNAGLMLMGKRKKVYRIEWIDPITSFKRKMRCNISQSLAISKFDMQER